MSVLFWIFICCAYLAYFLASISSEEEHEKVSLMKHIINTMPNGTKYV